MVTEKILLATVEAPGGAEVEIFVTRRGPFKWRWAATGKTGVDYTPEYFGEGAWRIPPAPRTLAEARVLVKQIFSHKILKARFSK